MALKHRYLNICYSVKLSDMNISMAMYYWGFKLLKNKKEPKFRKWENSNFMKGD